ncbi:putative beta-1,4-xylosyltransferase IRX9H [Canna indica]|uniref:Glycosyltransferases n=1 Tax=Canna indica TaxID=4628 RepID=A0AAQ3JKY5_9LILI|nr:putative beta-1,4-xylosyltransferase IRX9H [Canna indica]
MASFRRSILGGQRGGAVQNGEESIDDEFSTKLSHSETYFTGRRFLKSLLNSLANSIQDSFIVLFLRPSSRFGERSKAKGLHWKKVLLRSAIFFMIGIFIGFTPFLSVDVPNTSSPRHQVFSFEEDPGAVDYHRKLGMVHKDVKKSDVVEVEHDPDEKLVVKNKSSTPEMELDHQKLLIIVTPTYVRPFQVYHLNRLAHTLRNVPPPLLWLVVEMSIRSSETAKILRGSGVMYRHLVCKQNTTNIKDASLNTALSHIEEHRLDGIIHFADDNGVYSIHLFDQMRQIRRFGTWPVAILTGSEKQVSLEGPVCNGSQVIGWHRNRSRMTRRFHTAMAGFAFHSTILWEPNRWLRLNPVPKRKHDLVEDNSEETAFIEELFEDEIQMEGLANNCSLIMVWRLEVEGPELTYPKGWLMQKNLEVVVPIA